MGTYSFQNVSATLTGIAGTIPNMGYGSASADEGITVSRAEDVNTMMAGADGEVMHSLHKAKHGTVTVRLLKTSPTNALLVALYNIQTANSRLHGKNVIVITNSANAELHTCREVAFKKMPDFNFKKDGDIVEWQFDAGKIDSIAGVY